ncbi:MAG: substrate-binding domain-containing protein [Clostridiales bacterium]|nr:substrate-binding domain-containing protein [Clostridiales bacterium]
MTNANLPKYEQILTDMTERIQSGNLTPGDRVPTERELIAHYQVSRITVVKALTELTLSGYIHRVQGKGSFVNPFEQHLAPSSRKHPQPGRSAQGVPQRVGLLIPEHADYHSGSIIRGVTDTLRYPQHFVQLVITNACGLEEYALKQCDKGDYAGVILFPVDCEFYSDIIVRMCLNKFPLVLLDRSFPGIQSNTVRVDNEEGGRLAIEHLLGLGHQHISFLSDASFKEQVTRKRYDAYITAMAEHRLPAHAIEHFNRQKVAEQDVTKFMQFIRQDGGTAVVASNSHAAELVMELCLDHGIRVPEDLSIVCFDQPSPIPDAKAPQITYVEQNSYEMGRRAAQLLSEAMDPDKEHTYRDVVLTPQLVVRHSTAGPHPRG